MRDMMNIVEPLIPGLRRYARSITKDVSAADDLVQDCLVHAIDKWHQRRSDCTTRPWLYRILHNLAINHLKRNARRGVSVDIDAIADGAVSHPAEQEAKLVLRDLAVAVDRLPLEQCDVLLLISIEDLSYTETALVLNVPVGIVMSRFSRARVKLRQYMDEGSQAGDTYLRRVK